MKEKKDNWKVQVRKFWAGLGMILFFIGLSSIFVGIILQIKSLGVALCWAGGITGALGLIVSIAASD